jgi:glucosamine--fructose-6-phosphate aminotransferase (isomerizing)
MCGIIGYVGEQNAVPVIIDALRRLEYRGYDSSGIAYFAERQLQVRRAAGKLAALTELLPSNVADGGVGIGHTRWATHGRPTEENAHPHRYGSLVLVHNGIIENYLSLKTDLKKAGHVFTSDTDTEVIVHLISRLYEPAGKDGVLASSLEDAVRAAVSKMRGSFSFCLLSEREPDRMIAVRSGCPLVVGIGKNESFVASDIPAFLSHTREVLYLNDGEIAFFSRDGVKVETIGGEVVVKPTQRVAWDPVMAEKGGYRHFMLKEIHEQSRAIMDTLRGRVIQETGTVVSDGVSPEMEAVYRDCRRIILLGCGTSWHAALIGKFLIEGLARIPVEVDIASEFRYRDPQIAKGDLVVVVSQSGETADTLAALREARHLGVGTLAICNVVGSGIAREADSVFYTHAGPEISVASTKAFTTQLVSLLLLAIRLGQLRQTLSEAEASLLIHHLVLLPRQIEEVLSHEGQIREMAERYFRRSSFLYLGRGMHYPVALEGALKLKEVSYIHAEGYPAGEMKHGPIALIDEEMPVVILAPRDRVYEKVVSNAMEVKARGGKILAFVEEGDEEMAQIADEIFAIPKSSPHVSPILMSIPLQLLAYYIAVRRGNDVDQPRNLAKSVTVE